MKQYIKVINGETVIKKRNQIVIKKDGYQYINPKEEMLFSEGWEEYIPQTVSTNLAPIKSRQTIIQELVTKQWNERTDISNAEALDYAVIVFDFEHYIGQELAQGKIVSSDNKLWRVRQTHTCQADWTPSLDSASLWEVIEVEHEGTEVDPIPYAPPMEIFSGKYYTEADQLYLCTRDSGTALSHPLSALVGLYVEQVNK